MWKLGIKFSPKQIKNSLLEDKDAISQAKEIKRDVWKEMY